MNGLRADQKIAVSANVFIALGGHTSSTGKAFNNASSEQTRIYLANTSRDVIISFFSLFYNELLYKMVS